MGVQVIKILRQLGNADFLIKVTYVLMLGFVGFYMFIESLQALKKDKVAVVAAKNVITSYSIHYTKLYDEGDRHHDPFKLFSDTHFLSSSLSSSVSDYSLP